MHHHHMKRGRPSASDERRRHSDFPPFVPGGFAPPAFGPGGFGPGPGFGPPWMRGRAGGRRRSKGDIRLAIIALLAESDAPAYNGYGLMRAIGERTEGAWRPSPGSVYPTLQQLVDEGLVTAKGDGRSTEYELSAEGRAYADEHTEEIAGWDAGPRPSDASRELMESIGRLMSVVGQYREAATDAQRTAAAGKIDELRKALYLILAE